MAKWFNRLRISIIIGCLNIFVYLVVGTVVIENIKYDRYSHYDYDDYHDVYKSYERREQTRLHREFYCKIYVAVCVVMVVVSALLIWGVIKKRPYYISPWLLMSLVVLIYSSIIILDDIFVKTSFQGVAHAALFYIILFIVFGFQVSCLGVVYSTFKHIELEMILQGLQQPGSSPNQDIRKKITTETQKSNQESNLHHQSVHQYKSKAKKSNPNKKELRKSK